MGPSPKETRKGKQFVQTPIDSFVSKRSVPDAEPSRRSDWNQHPVGRNVASGGAIANAFAEQAAARQLLENQARASKVVDVLPSFSNSASSVPLDVESYLPDARVGPDNHMKSQLEFLKTEVEKLEQRKMELSEKSEGHSVQRKHAQQVQARSRARNPAGAAPGSQPYSRPSDDYREERVAPATGARAPPLSSRRKSPEAQYSKRDDKPTPNPNSWNNPLTVLAWLLVLLLVFLAGGVCLILSRNVNAGRQADVAPAGTQPIPGQPVQSQSAAQVAMLQELTAALQQCERSSSTALDSLQEQIQDLRASNHTCERELKQALAATRSCEGQAFMETLDVTSDKLARLCDAPLDVYTTDRQADAMRMEECRRGVYKLQSTLNDIASTRYGIDIYSSRGMEPHLSQKLNTFHDATLKELTKYHDMDLNRLTSTCSDQLTKLRSDLQQQQITYDTTLRNIAETRLDREMHLNKTYFAELEDARIREAELRLQYDTTLDERETLRIEMLQLNHTCKSDVAVLRQQADNFGTFHNDTLLQMTRAHEAQLKQVNQSARVSDRECRMSLEKAEKNFEVKEKQILNDMEKLVRSHEVKLETVEAQCKAHTSQLQNSLNATVEQYSASYSSQVEQLLVSCDATTSQLNDYIGKLKAGIDADLAQAVKDLELTIVKKDSTILQLQKDIERTARTQEAELAKLTRVQEEQLVANSKKVGQIHESNSASVKKAHALQLEEVRRACKITTTELTHDVDRLTGARDIVIAQFEKKIAEIERTHLREVKSLNTTIDRAGSVHNAKVMELNTHIERLLENADKLCEGGSKDLLVSHRKSLEHAEKACAQTKKEMQDSFQGTVSEYNAKLASLERQLASAIANPPASSSGESGKAADEVAHSEMLRKLQEELLDAREQIRNASLSQKWEENSEYVEAAPVVDDELLMTGVRMAFSAILGAALTFFLPRTASTDPAPTISAKPELSKKGSKYFKAKKPEVEKEVEKLKETATIGTQTTENPFLAMKKVELPSSMKTGVSESKQAEGDVMSGLFNNLGLFNKDEANGGKDEKKPNYVARLAPGNQGKTKPNILAKHTTEDGVKIFQVAFYPEGHPKLESGEPIENLEIPPLKSKDAPEGAAATAPEGVKHEGKVAKKNSKKSKMKMDGDQVPKTKVDTSKLPANVQKLLEEEDKEEWSTRAMMGSLVDSFRKSKSKDPLNESAD
ncbi:hypothetical protein CYMTET_47884 [Cymbomonas tetramitiformis]|uniref:Uncharacterized protein n=1 Tax=Cymbomonas tetramitiformis TaxID=36881 RepID=A0AAE0BTA4_9CHLO|nr:hypothetical protein CYMTET_47884 [Cymbomonas tetramitiformis]